VLPFYIPFAGLLFGLHAVARRCSPRVAKVALAACILPLGINSYNVAAVQQGNLLINLIFASLIWVSLGLLVWGLARTTYTADRRAEQLRQADAAAAVRAERLRLARELHDIVSHAVSAMLLQAAGAQAVLERDVEQVKRSLETIETAGVQAMRELHRLLGLLRSTDPRASEEGNEDAPTLARLPDLVALTRASGVDVETVVDGRPARLDPSVDMAAYRILQETLTNTLKHGGRGASAHIHVHWDDDSLTLTVRDRPGIPSTIAMTELSSGFGLSGLAERVSSVGGRLEAGPISGGFLVRAELPTSVKPVDKGLVALPTRDRP
jgi:signal transduction histidine kinase